MDEEKNIEGLSDFDKLHIWNEICIKNKWSKEYELEKWLLKVGVTFTANGSAVPNDYYEISNRYDLEVYVNGIGEEGLATLVLEYLSGVLKFKELGHEKYFWILVRRRMKKEFGVSIPKRIIPNYITNGMKRDVERIEESNIENID